MREKLMTLTVAELKELAKSQGMKSASGKRKAELVEWLASRWEEEVKRKEEERAAKQAAAEEPAAPGPADVKGSESEPEPEPEPEPAPAPEQENGPEPEEPQIIPETPQSASRTLPQEPEIRLPEELQSIADKGPPASGILELHPDGYGFLRTGNYLNGTDDVYVSQSQIRRFGMRTGDLVTGIRRARSERDKNAGLLYVSSVNGLRPSEIQRRDRFDDMTPIFPDRRIHLEVPGASTAMRLVDLISPIGKGQRGMIVSPPKAGKTTLLKQIAKVITDTCPEIHLIILLIDERPEEVTDIREYIQGPQVEVAASTFDREPEQHRKLSEMVIERARRLVESHMDVVILLDSITRLARAYNLVVTPSGRTLSGGLDPAALNMPKRFFGAARNMREGGSLTILATALVETGSRMDDVIYEEFKGTGNMELVLDRKLSERRIFPAVDILKSGTRRDDLLLSREEREVLDMIHRATNGNRPEESVERILDLFARTKSNAELIRQARYNRRI